MAALRRSPGAAQSSSRRHAYAYVAWFRCHAEACNEGGVEIIDVSDPAAPARVGSYAAPGAAEDVHVAEWYAYVIAEACGFFLPCEGGQQVMDVADPTAPTEVNGQNTPGTAKAVYVAGSYAYVADGMGGLAILRFIPGEAWRVFLPIIRWADLDPRYRRFDPSGPWYRRMVRPAGVREPVLDSAD